MPIATSSDKIILSSEKKTEELANKLLKNIDQFLFKISIIKKLAWSVLIIAEKN